MTLKDLTQGPIIPKVLERLPTHPYSRISELLPTHWKPNSVLKQLRHAARSRSIHDGIRLNPTNSRRVAVKLRNLLDNTKYQIENHVFDADELAGRFHHQLVWIHAFPNGNGRHARLMADFLAMRLGRPRLTWGGGEASITTVGELRDQYLAALRTADQGQFGDLIAFARS